MATVAYVVLHYITLEDTLECVNSILNNVNDSEIKKHIVIVDNGSSNKTGNELQKIYSNTDIVTVLISKKNLGFSKGNNIGFQYSKYVLKADFIVVLNSDTVIKQKDFSHTICKKFSENHFAVLGPDIITRDGIHQNPASLHNWTRIGIRIFQIKTFFHLMANYIGLDEWYTKRIIKLTNCGRPNGAIAEDNKADIENVQLNGCCLIFSQKYISRFDGLHDKVFLYLEEDILWLVCKCYNLLMVYTGELTIYHKGQGATNYTLKDKSKRNRRHYKLSISSANELYKLRKQYELGKPLEVSAAMQSSSILNN